MGESMQFDTKLRNRGSEGGRGGGGEEETQSCQRRYGKMKREGEEERKESWFLTSAMKAEAGSRRGRYRPGINRDQNGVTEKRERTAAAAQTRAGQGLRGERGGERDRGYPEKAQTSGRSRQA